MYTKIIRILHEALDQIKNISIFSIDGYTDISLACVCDDQIPIVVYGNYLANWM